MGKKYIRKTREIEEKFDPLNVLPPEILDIILGYLGVEDLLNLSLSSLNWYSTIAKSECLKKKAKLVIQCESLDAKMVKILLNSTREYQNIHISHPSRSEITTDSKKDINTILKKFGNSIKSLETPFDIPRICDMPKLRKFVFDSSRCYLLCNRMIKFYETGLFKKLELIEELYIRQNIWKKKFLKHLKDILPTMKHLKLLRVSENIITDADYSFKLRQFQCCGFIEDEDSMNMSKFLKSQSASLEVLNIQFSTSRNDIDDMLSIILAMPNLNKLILWSSSNEVNTTGLLPINKTIKSISILDCEENVNILAFLKSLQVLQVHEITPNLVNAISICPSLRQVQYRFFNKFNLPADYMRTVRQQHPNIQFIKRNYCACCY